MNYNKFQKPLPPEEFNQLIKQRNNPEIKEKLILHNLKLVMWAARQFPIKGIDDIDDYFQVGIIGLIKAIEKFDPEKGTFATYAIWYIRAEIRRYLDNYTRLIRIPSYVIGEINAIRIAINDLSLELSREPTVKEISTRTTLSVYKINRLMNIMQDPASYYIQNEDGEEISIVDAIPDEGPSPEDIALDKVVLDELDDIIKPELTELEYKSFMMFYGLNSRMYTLKEVSQILGKSPVVIEAAKTKAMRIIRKSNFVHYLEGEIDKRTVFIKSIDYSKPRNPHSGFYSATEQAVIQREGLRAYLEKKYLGDSEDTKLLNDSPQSF